MRPDLEADFERLARLVTGTAVTLVLGGGGARGFAHIGAIRALEEAGIPIDMIGGTSMGAVIAAQYAVGLRYQQMLHWNRRAWLEIKPHSEFTVPVISLVRGTRGEKASVLVYGDRQIEDLWTSYFCISSNLTKAEVMVHSRGLLRKAVTASASLPGIAPPILHKGNVLIDGGLLNNLPTDVMRRMCNGDVIAIDVGSELHCDIDGDELPSPWSVIFQKLMPGRAPAKTLTIFDVLVGATFVGGESRLKELKRHADYYLRPPVERYSFLDLQSLEEIAEVGYMYTKRQIESWKEGNWPGQRIRRGELENCDLGAQPGRAHSWGLL
jgi:predicted acylesterase/phospholipase RssA